MKNKITPLMALLFLTVSILCMSIGYSALTTNLLISGEAVVIAPPDIIISNLEVKDMVDGAYETYSNSLTKNSTLMYASLPNYSSMLVYEVTIKNTTNDKYLLKNIEELFISNERIKWEIRNITYSTLILPGETKFEVVLYYDNTLYNNENININLKYNFELSSNYQDESLNGGDPVITNNLIPVTLSPDGTVYKADTYEKWYDYNNKEWANAVVIKDNVNASNYEKALPGTVIDQEHIALYYVWIPRYEYQIFDDDDPVGRWNEDNNEQQEIFIRFVGIDEIKKTSTIRGDWYTHPAFTITSNSGVSEISGFWIQKFELTGTQSLPTSVPNSKSLRNLNLSTYFSTIQNIISVYNLSINKVDSHLIKNSEWSAVAYLSNSLYGKNSQVWPNAYSSQLTGCSSNSESDKSNSACVNGYGTSQLNIYNSSTTGNITGVFDMSGSLWERTMGVMLTESGEFSPAQSGFVNLDKKYYDSYTYGTSGNQYYRSGYGQAINETAGWYSDSSVFINNIASPWLIRSAESSSGATAGLYTFMPSNGASYWSHGTRGTLWVSK